MGYERANKNEPPALNLITLLNMELENGVIQANTTFLSSSPPSSR
jgi:hypothetical protein